MKSLNVLALHTYTDCENKYRSLQAIGHRVSLLQYDDRPHELHGEYVNIARRLRPDVIVMIGAIEQYHGRPVPRPDILKALKEVAPFIHICDDAGDPPWWPMLEVYDQERCFTVQVSIDGSAGTPIDRFDNGLTLLTPIDHRPFEKYRLNRWEHRQIKLGMIGGIGHPGQPRRAMLEVLRDRGILDFREGPTGRPYDEMAAIMGTTKITYNYGQTGSGQKMHVKGRVVEAGFAGSALIEQAGSPLFNWFDIGHHFMYVDTPDEIEKLLRDISDAEWMEMANRFGSTVRIRHHPEIFWRTVFAKAKLQVHDA